MSDGIFRVLFFVCVIAESAIRVVYTRQHKLRGTAFRRERGLSGLAALPSLGMFIVPLLYVLTSWLDFADYQLPMWAGWVGVVIFAASPWLLWRSHADLGLNWLPTPDIREGHTLVTDGVFRYIRHPMYAAHWLWAIAQPLLLQNWIAGLSMAASMLPLYLVRVRQEEQMMLEQFGEEYRVYMGRTGRVVPRLWR